MLKHHFWDFAYAEREKESQPQTATGEASPYNMQVCPVLKGVKLCWRQIRTHQEKKDKCCIASKYALMSHPILFATRKQRSVRGHIGRNSNILRCCDKLLSRPFFQNWFRTSLSLEWVEILFLLPELIKLSTTSCTWNRSRYNVPFYFLR